jgi:hypothetical protein
MIDYLALLTKLAVVREARDKRVADLKHARERVVEYFDQQIDAAEQVVAAVEREIVDAAAEHIRQYDCVPHAAIHYSRRTDLVYDKEAVLARLLEAGDVTFVRTKRELDVRKFEKGWRDGFIDDPAIEVQIVDAPSVTISQKLGDFLILADAAPLTP